MPRWLIALIALAFYIPLTWLIGTQLANAADWLVDGLRDVFGHYFPDTIRSGALSIFASVV